MSAVVIPFKGEWQGRAKPERRSAADRAECRALHDARLIRAAKVKNDDWTARFLLALLETLSSEQLDMLEFRVIGKTGINSESAAQALAIIQLAAGTNSHKDKVRAYLDRMAAREAE